MVNHAVYGASDADVGGNQPDIVHVWCFRIELFPHEFACQLLKCAGLDVETIEQVVDLREAFIWSHGASAT